jgi:hypothetical protein
VIILAGLLVFLWEDVMTYAALYTAFAVPLLSFAVTAFCAGRFGIAEKLSNETVVKGESAEYFFTVINKSFVIFSRVSAEFFTDAAIAPGVEMTDSEIVSVAEVKKSFSIKPFGKKVVAFAVTCPYRGEYRLGVNKLTVYDALGLFKFSRNFLKDDAMTIYVNPRLIKKETALVAREDEAPRSFNLINGDDTAVISDLREYVYGDSMRKVHWKATARRNELIIKNFQAISKSFCVFVFDNGLMDKIPPSEAIVKQDQMIEDLVGMAKYACDERFPALIMHFSKPFDLSPAPFEKLYAEAAELRFDAEDVDICKMLDDIAFAAHDFINIVVFAQAQDGSVEEKADKLRIFGHNIVIHETIIKAAEVS